MKNFRSLLSVSLIALALAASPAHATNTSTINPNNPAQNSALSSSVLRANFICAYNDINNIYNLIANIVTTGITSLTGDVTTGTPASGVATATVGRVNGVSYSASPTVGTVPVVTNTNVTTYELVPNTALVNSTVTIAGHVVSLGSSQPLAASDLSNGINGTGAVVLATGNAATATLASTVTTNANLSGVVTSVGNTTSFGSFSSATLRTALSDETGTGSAVFSTSPTLTTPVLGAATGTSVNLSGAATALNFAATGTGANVLPVGTTGQEPTPAEGMLRDNTTLHMLEAYINGGWQQVVSAANGLINLATQVTGTLPVANGGTGANNPDDALANLGGASLYYVKNYVANNSSPTTIYGGTTTYSTGTYTAIFPKPLPATLAAGQTYEINFNQTNPSTANLVLGTRPSQIIKVVNNSGTLLNLVGGEIVPGPALVYYDGTEFIYGAPIANSTPVTGATLATQADFTGRTTFYIPSTAQTITLPCANTLSTTGQIIVLPIANAATIAKGSGCSDTLNMNGTTGTSVTVVQGASAAFVTTDGSSNFYISGGASGGGGAVSSVFGRTGAVTATSGDYTAAQVTGAAPLSFPNFAGAGAASTPSVNFTGTLFTGGTATTTQPNVYLNNGATAPTSWSTAGTEFGINAPSGFTGNFIDMHLNGGASLFKINQAGLVSAANALTTSSYVQASGALISGSYISVNSTAYLTTPTTATWQIGQADAAAPVAQTLMVQGVATGTSNTVGQNFTINGSAGTGTGAGGSIILQTAPAGSTGSAKNTYVAALTIPSGGDLQLSGAIPTASAGTVTTGSTSNKGSISALSAATTDTITFATNAPLSAAPSCSFTGSAALASPAITSMTTTAVTVTMTAFTGTLYYVCF